MKHLKIITLLLGLAFTVRAGDLQTGETFIDGQSVHASDLNQAVNGATLQPPAITAKPLNSAPGYSDYLLGYSPASGTLYKTTVQNFFANVQSITLLPSGMPNYTNQDLFSFYSATGTNLQSVAFSKLVLDISTNLSVSKFSYASNGVYSLPPFPYTFSANNTNNQPYFLTWGTNGVPYQVSLSNLESSFTTDLSSNQVALANIYNQIFLPWTVYGTNTWGTNIYGTNISFAITTLQNTFGNTNALNISTNDAFPLLSTGQFTNTTATIGSLIAFLQNQNALPSYTQARISFGSPTNVGFDNHVDTGNNVFFTTNTTLFTITNTPLCASFFTVAGGTLPTANGSALVTNTPYWIVKTAGSGTAPFTNGFRIYTNYATAVLQTNWVAAGSGIFTNRLNVVPVFTAFNSDIIQLSSGNTEQAGQFSMYFRTPSTTTNYYVTGSCMASASQQGIISVDNASVITTNNVWVDTDNPNTANTGLNFPRSWILISPQ